MATPTRKSKVYLNQTDRHRCINYGVCHTCVYTPPIPVVWSTRWNRSINLVVCEECLEYAIEAYGCVHSHLREYEVIRLDGSTIREIIRELIEYMPVVVYALPDLLDHINQDLDRDVTACA